MRAAIDLLTRERRWLSQTLAQAASEIDSGADLLTESLLREQVAQLAWEFAQVVEALGILRGRPHLVGDVL